MGSAIRSGMLMLYSQQALEDQQSLDSVTSVVKLMSTIYEQHYFLFIVLELLGLLGF